MAGRGDGPEVEKTALGGSLPTTFVWHCGSRSVIQDSDNERWNYITESLGATAQW